MLRLLVLVLAGALPAAAITWTLLPAGDEPTVSTSEAQVEPEVDGVNEQDSGVSSQRLELYTTAAAYSDSIDIESRLTTLLGEPYSRENRVEIEALFARLAALDLSRALAIAARPGFDTGLVTDVFRSWAERDPEAAIQVLGAIRNQSVRSAAALAVVAVMGYDAAIIERIAALLPESDSIRFQAMALEQLAKDNPDGALGQALALGEKAARNSAVQRVAIEWVNQDPETAHARHATLPPELRDAYRDTVSSEWARVHPDSFLDFLDRQDNLSSELLGLGHAMTYDPERLFEISQRHAAVQFYDLGSLESVVYNVVAQVDFDYAMSYLDTIDNAARASRLTTVMARTYGREDPDAAIAWARNFSPPRPELEAAVIGQIAAVDMDKSLRLMREFANGSDSGNAMGSMQLQNVASFIGRFAASDPKREEIASALVARGDDPDARMVLQQITSRWVRTDPASALDWMLGNEAAMDPLIVSNIGQALASQDPRVAASYVNRIPEDMRQSWMQQVAIPYARYDPEGAVDWIAQFRGSPAYDEVVPQVIAQTASTNPVAAAAMLASAPVPVQQETAGSVARGWAQKDLTAAARWATQLGDEAGRRDAVGGVASAWAQRDPDAAQRWAANLPENGGRAEAVSTVMSTVLVQGSDISASLADAFDSPAAMQRAAARSIARLASWDPDRAEELLDTWVTEPEIRQSAERSISQSRDRYGL